MPKGNKSFEQHVKEAGKLGGLLKRTTAYGMRYTSVPSHAVKNGKYPLESGYDRRRSAHKTGYG